MITRTSRKYGEYFHRKRNALKGVGVSMDSKSSLYVQDLHKILQTIN